jgi:hypothetical protein
MMTGQFDEQEWINDGCPTLETLYPVYVEQRRELRQARERIEELKIVLQSHKDGEQRQYEARERAETELRYRQKTTLQLIEEAHAAPGYDGWKRPSGSGDR